MQIPIVEEPQDHPHPHISEEIDSWLWLECHKSVSATRPPVLNTDNYSCAERGARTDGLEKHVTQDHHIYAGEIFEHVPGQEKQLAYHVPPSYSSNQSVKAPEGPERLDPNDHLSDIHGPVGFLSLCPEVGHNEKQHRRTSSFHQTMPLTMQRFLDHSDDPDSAERIFFRFPLENHECTGFLKQDPFLRSSSSMKVHKGSNETRPSQQMPIGGESGMRMRLSLSWGLDPTTGAGDWVGQQTEDDVEDEMCMWMADVGFDDEM